MKTKRGNCELKRKRKFGFNYSKLGFQYEKFGFRIK
ncbi:MAG: hypothetical protein ACJA0Q_002239 [Saprospiraceae bacterium]|jgi:hypothetical protein